MGNTGKENQTGKTEDAGLKDKKRWEKQRKTEVLNIKEVWLAKQERYGKRKG